MEKKELNNIICCLIAWISIRIIFLSKFPIGYDSTHFLKVARDCSLNGRFLYDIGCIIGDKALPLFIFISSLLIPVIFYYICRSYCSQNSSLLATILISISPFMFYQTQYNFIDKNVFEIIFILINYYNLLCEKNIYKSMLISLITLSIFFYVWEGAILLFALISKLYLLRLIIEKKYLTAMALWGAIGLFILIEFNKIIEYIIYFLHSQDKTIISEMISPLFLGFKLEYLLFIFIFLMLLYEIPNILKILSVTSLLMFLVAYRLNIFLIPIIYISIALFIDKFRLKGIGLVFIIFLLISGTATYTSKTFIDDDYLIAMKYLNDSNKNCIISLWQNGHALKYYTDKEVYYYATSENLEGQLGVLVYEGKTDCSIFFTKKDLDSLKYIVPKISVNDYWIIRNIGLFHKFGDNYVL